MCGVWSCPRFSQSFLSTSKRTSELSQVGSKTLPTKRNFYTEFSDRTQRRLQDRPWLQGTVLLGVIEEALDTEAYSLSIIPHKSPHERSIPKSSVCRPQISGHWKLSCFNHIRICWPPATELPPTCRSTGSKSIEIHPSISHRHVFRSIPSQPCQARTARYRYTTTFKSIVVDICLIFNSS